MRMKEESEALKSFIEVLASQSKGWKPTFNVKTLKGYLVAAGIKDLSVYAQSLVCSRFAGQTNFGKNKVVAALADLA